ncbi:hypothetical protein ACFE04_027294 [Oxalis oulophora]
MCDWVVFVNNRFLVLDEKDVHGGTVVIPDFVCICKQTLPGIWSLHCHALMGDKILLTTVHGKQWVVRVIRKKDGSIILSGDSVRMFYAHYNISVCNEVEFQTGSGNNFFVRIRNKKGVEIDYECDDRLPIDRKNRLPPTMCLLLWEEGLDTGMLMVVADGFTWNLVTRKNPDNTVSLTGAELKYFIKHYNVQTSYRLMFEYMDDGLFRLTIMDNIGVEIDYPKVVSIGIINTETTSI